jgi:hypothetical protein
VRQSLIKCNVTLWTQVTPPDHGPRETLITIGRNAHPDDGFYPLNIIEEAARSD